MVNENKIFIENKKPFETVYEIEKYEIKKSPLSPAARGKIINKSGSNYLGENGDDYGPCKNSLCGCYCSSSTCNCSNVSARVVGPTGTGFSASGRAKGGNLSGQASSHAFSIKDDSGEARFLSSEAGGSVGKDGIGVRAGVDLANVKSGGVQARVGVNVDTGVSTDDGSLGVKAAGFGLSVGKQTGISTPLGEIKVDTDDCVIQ